MRVLLGAFGSAGDVLPSIAVGRALRERGCDVALVGPRSAGLYARAAGIEALAVGDGREMAVLRDERIYTTEGDGFASWHRTLEHYLTPLIERQHDTDAAVAAWAPDVVAVHPLATFASLAAERLGIPWASVHLYPQLVPSAVGGVASPPPGFAPGYALAVKEVERAAGLPERFPPLGGWGWSGVVDLSVHDPALVARTSLAAAEIGEPLGFPYWDDVPADRDDVERAVEALSGSGSPSVVLTLGSFVGKARAEVWSRLGLACRRLGATCVAVGVPLPMRDDLERCSGLVCTGFVPHSTVFPLADAVIHHGGIGTTYAGLLAGRRCGVLPQAFDQTFNARLLEDAGLGRRLAVDEGLPAALESLLVADASAAAELAGALVRPAEAARALADRITAVGGDR